MNPDPDSDSLKGGGMIRDARIVVAGCLILAACGGSTTDERGSAADPAARTEEVSFDKNDYPVFPDADAGADPSVSAEDGGAGFTGEGWETNTDFDLIGDPRALKGGSFKEDIPDFPGTLRIFGPESNTTIPRNIWNMVYESLLSLHPTTLEYIPNLATHWQISEDKRTYRYRINPNARFSDGEAVEAEDVVATWNFIMDEGLQYPMGRVSYSKFEEPVAESKYIVRVTSAQDNWRNFLYFSASMPVLPAHVLKEVDGARYLQEYNFKVLPGSGAYAVGEGDVEKGKSVTLRRREDHWAASNRQNVGVNNFDAIETVVVRDRNLAFEMFKRGDLDYYLVTRARYWVEEMDFDKVQRGLIQKRRIYNQNPQGVQGLAFNMRRPPFDDLRVRKALTYLQNREQMIEKLFYGMYEPMNSYYPGSLYENPDNPLNLFDPEKAMALLAEAGWKERDAQGRLIRDGQPLTVELLYRSELAETYLTVYQEDLRKAGIALNLRLVTGETMFSLLMQRKFDVASMAWSGLVFPNPETSYLSSLADQDNTNNINGIKNDRIDEICAEYDLTFNLDQRVKLIRELDGILANTYPYVLAWTAPFVRLGYWNKFGHPDSYLTRTGDYRDMMTLWWIDPERKARLEQAMGDPSIQLEVGETDQKPWVGFGQAELSDN